MTYDIDNNEIKNIVGRLVIFWASDIENNAKKLAIPRKTAAIMYFILNSASFSMYKNASSIELAPNLSPLMSIISNFG